MVTTQTLSRSLLMSDDETWDQDMKAWMDWFMIHEGIYPHSDEKWWAAFAGVWSKIATMYGLDYLWWVATGERGRSGMNDTDEPSPEYRAQTRAEFVKLGANLPPDHSKETQP